MGSLRQWTNSGENKSWHSFLEISFIFSKIKYLIMPFVKFSEHVFYEGLPNGFVFIHCASSLNVKFNGFYLLYFLGF